MNDDFVQALIHDFVEEARPMTERLGEAFLRMERCWSEGLRVDGWLNIPRVVFDIHELQAWFVQHGGWQVHPSILREAQWFAECRWMWRAHEFEQRARLFGNGNGKE